MFDHFGITCLAHLSQCQKQLEADESPGPLNGGGVRIVNSAVGFGGHEIRIRAKSLANRVGMTAEKHPGSHRHGEPFVSIARDGIGSVDSGKVMLEPR